MSVTIAEQIMRAVAALIEHGDVQKFTEDMLVEQIDKDRTVWDSGYAAIYRGMHTERPAGAPDSGARYRNVFSRINATESMLTPYGKDLAGQMRSKPRISETLELPRVETDSEAMDGLRAWQAAVVRLWSASEESFAELSLTWFPDPHEGAPWTSRLYCGDRAPDGWAEDVRIMSSHSIQQALQRLWDRAQVRHGLFKDDKDLNVRLPTDFPADMWLTTAERAVIDRAINALHRLHPKTALRVTYFPERRLSGRWLAVVVPLEADSAENPEASLFEVEGSTLLLAGSALLHAMENPQQTAEFTPVDPEIKALMERKTVKGIEAEIPDADRPDTGEPDEA